MKWIVCGQDENRTVSHDSVREGCWPLSCYGIAGKEEKPEKPHPLKNHATGGLCAPNSEPHFCEEQCRVAIEGC
jgi:hypothetical protein